MKNLAIIGSTGSIGTQVLNVVRAYPDKFKVVALSANSNVQLLAEQAKEFLPKIIGIADQKYYNQLLSFKTGCTVVSGATALEDCITFSKPDLSVISVVGMCGLKSVVASIENNIDVALANKESLVSGGEMVMKLAKKHNVKILPIDSEHSAVWQTLLSGKKADLKRIILTASGGAYYNKTLAELKNITPEQAVKHPNWNMGKKISVDCSTMMNKGLEIIEARWLFDTFNIDYIIHPQSIIHSMVEFNDGAIIAQLSSPNMELPIQLALTYPDRLKNDVKPWDFSKSLTFSQPNEELFPLPKLAKYALKCGGNMPCILNAANEAAVALFLNSKISFLDISSVIEKELSSSICINSPSLNDIYETHNNVFNKVSREHK